MISSQVATQNDFEFIPTAMLSKHLQDQKKILKQWGITLPAEQELFQDDCPLWVKVQFFDWIIREGLEA